MVKNIIKIIAIFIIGAIGGIFADQILWPYFIERPLFYKYRLEQNPVYVIEKKEVIIQENIALIEAINKVKNSIVAIKTEPKKGKTIFGSGIIVTSDGLMVTLAELVPFGSNFNFYIANKKVHFQILKRGLKENLALIKIKTDENLSTCGFADFEKIKLGKRVILIGTIFDNNEPKLMVNEGIIKYFDKNYIHTNIFEKKTLSGSSLFDIEGNLLGLNEIDKEGKIISISIEKIKEFIGL